MCFYGFDLIDLDIMRAVMIFVLVRLVVVLQLHFVL